MSSVRAVRSVPSLTVTEAAVRAASISVTSYDVELDLTRGDDVFFARSTIAFDSLDGQDTFLDVQPVELHSVRLNERPLDVADLRDGRVQLTDLSTTNVLVCESTMAYSHDGSGLHRAVDPEDGRPYVYAMTFLESAPRVFGCFDQPDLKSVFRLSVRTPTEWTVVGNCPGEQIEPGHWILEETKPISTYLVTLVAGPYYSVTGSHDGIDLGFHCRQTLAPQLDKDRDELFTVTGQSFDELHRLFGIRYPFGHYQQAFVPQFNAGAMENPGCVTFTDAFMFRAQASDSLHATRTMVIAHEMAHMWFGDLVTMKWWDDLWLNESFAEYMGYRVTNDATEFDDVWIDFGFSRKAWGFAADQRRSTHPVAGNGAHTARQALNDFDGISYSKGAAALRQLNAFLGDETFLRGVADHLNRHAYGNASLVDLLDSWQAVSDRDVHAWAERWLRVPGVDSLSMERASDTARVVRTAGSPDGIARPHSFTVTAYAQEQQPRSSLVHAVDDITPVDLPAGPEAFVLVDSGDDTWAKVVLDDASMAGAADALGLIDDPLARSVVWSSLREAVFDARLAPDVYADVVAAALPREPDVSVERILGALTGTRPLLGTYLSTSRQRDVLGATAAAILEAAPPSSNRQLIAARGVISLGADRELLTAWLSGNGPEGLLIDDDLRWRIILRLCCRGEFTGADIDAELERDRSSQGLESSTECRAAIPTEEAKAAAWETLLTDTALPNSQIYRLASGFFQPGQDALLAPYVPRFFEEFPRTTEFRDGWMVGQAAGHAYPKYAAEQSTVDLAEACVARDDIDPSCRRAISDATDDLIRVIASRTAFAPSEG